MANTAKILIILVLVALVGVGYYIFGYRPLEKKIVDEQKNIDELEVTLKQVQQVAKQYETINNEIRTLNSELKRLQKQLPEEIDEGDLVLVFNEMASSTGLNITRIKPMDVRQAEYYLEYPIEIELKGSYNKIAIFFEKLARQERVVNISELHLKEPKDESGVTEVVASCVATTYFFKGGS